MNGLRQKRGNRQHRQIIPTLSILRQRVRRDDLLGPTLRQPFPRRAGKHPVRAGNNHILGASIPQYTHRARDSAAGINHVIQQHRGLTRNITHHAVRHHLVSNLGRPGLMHKRQGGITQNIRPLLGHLHPAGIGGNHHHVLQRIIGLNIIRQNRHGMHVIHRTIKKALNLIGVQIHRHNPIRPSGLQQVGNQPGGNRLPPPVLLILPGIRIKRQNSGDVLRGTPL